MSVAVGVSPRENVHKTKSPVGAKCSSNLTTFRPYGALILNAIYPWVYTHGYRHYAPTELKCEAPSLISQMELFRVFFDNWIIKMIICCLAQFSVTL